MISTNEDHISTDGIFLAVSHSYADANQQGYRPRHKRVTQGGIAMSHMLRAMGILAESETSWEDATTDARIAETERGGTVP